MNKINKIFKILVCTIPLCAILCPIPCYADLYVPFEMGQDCSNIFLPLSVIIVQVGITAFVESLIFCWWVKDRKKELGDKYLKIRNRGLIIVIIVNVCTCFIINTITNAEFWAYVTYRMNFYVYGYTLLLDIISSSCKYWFVLEVIIIVVESLLYLMIPKKLKVNPFGFSIVANSITIFISALSSFIIFFITEVCNIEIGILLNNIPIINACKDYTVELSTWIFLLLSVLIFVAIILFNVFFKNKNKIRIKKTITIIFSIALICFSFLSIYSLEKSARSYNHEYAYHHPPQSIVS